MALGPWPGQQPLHVAALGGAVSTLSLRCLLSAPRPACSDFGCAGSHSPMLISCSMERRPRSGDTAFRPLHWPFLLLGLFKTVLGLPPPVCCLGEGQTCWSKWTL